MIAPGLANEMANMGHVKMRGPGYEQGHPGKQLNILSMQKPAREQLTEGSKSYCRSSCNVT